MLQENLGIDQDLTVKTLSKKTDILGQMQRKIERVSTLRNVDTTHLSEDEMMMV